jgi:hypothetical protein
MKYKLIFKESFQEVAKIAFAFIHQSLYWFHLSNIEKLQKKISGFEKG